MIDHVSYSERDENVSIDFALTMSLYDRETQFKRNNNNKKTRLIKFVSNYKVQL